MDQLVWPIRWAVFDHIKKHQVMPTLEQLSSSLGILSEQVEEKLLILSREYHSLAYDQNTKSISMAWPFSATPTDYPVDTPDGRYWANCAWDALSIPNLLNSDSKSIYQCPDCEEEIQITIENENLTPTKAVVHFSIPPKIFFEDLGCI